MASPGSNTRAQQQPRTRMSIEKYAENNKIVQDGVTLDCQRMMLAFDLAENAPSRFHQMNKAQQQVTAEWASALLAHDAALRYRGLIRAGLAIAAALIQVAEAASSLPELKYVEKSKVSMEMGKTIQTKMGLCKERFERVEPIMAGARTKLLAMAVEAGIRLVNYRSSIAGMY
ncbi:hypothetical protein LTR09_006954 [Extremus antarcticus]|uniref:Uncharacterized protein n=1 Tax=Extremus antarcticus TaxID=702011 RepID=A0AAJ0DDT0_9PEZI|nr:hypothetical protein LTR09_006954 [Extremus antarcticus]